MSTKNKALVSTPPESDLGIPMIVSDDPGVLAAMEALRLARKAQDLLSAHFRPMSPEERRSLGPVPRQFVKVGSTMVEALRPQTALLALMRDFDIDRMKTDMDRALVLTALANQIEQIADLASDASAFHESRAYTDVLPVYAVAKVSADHDASMRAVVSPLERVFASRARARKDPKV